MFVKYSYDLGFILRALLDDVVDNMQRLGALSIVEFLSLDHFLETCDQFAPVFIIQTQSGPVVYRGDIFEEYFAQASIHWAVDFATVDQTKEGR